MIRAEFQGCLDGFAAAGLLAYVLTQGRRRDAGPLAPRLVFLFGLLSVFYALRGLQLWTGERLLNIGVFSALALTPFAALLLAEGVLRRHAPRAMKIAIAGASAVSLGFALFTQQRFMFDTRIGLAAPMALSLGAILVLLALRDRNQLSADENRVVGGLAIGLAAAIPLILTDFQNLSPTPVGLSPIAALLIVFVILSSSVGDLRDAAVGIVLALAGAALLALALVRVLDVTEVARGLALFALVATAMIATALAARIVMLGAAARRSRLRMRLAVADTGSLDRFLADIADLPLLKDMAVVGESDLADYRLDDIAAALSRRPLWSLERLNAGEGASLVEREPLIDLLERGGATHLGLLGVAPLRVGLVRLPSLARGGDAELDLALAFRMARLAGSAER